MPFLELSRLMKSRWPLIGLDFESFEIVYISSHLLEKQRVLHLVWSSAPAAGGRGASAHSPGPSTCQPSD